MYKPRRQVRGVAQMSILLNRIVPELEILTTFLDLTLNFVTLIGRPQWNGRFFWQASLFHLPPKFSVRSRRKVTGTEFGNCT